MPSARNPQKKLTSAERERIEAALQKTEALFRSFMDNSPTFAWMKDAEGRYVYVSKAFENHFGVRLEDCSGKTDADLFPSELAQLYRENDLSVLTANCPLQLTENSADPEDGSLCTWLVTKFPFSAASGERFVGGVGVDITESRRAVEMWRHLSAIVESSYDAIISKTLDGTITSWNPAAEQLYGYSSAEMLGQSISVLFPPDATNELADILRRVANREFIEDYVTVRRRKDGRLVDVSLRISPILDGSGNVVGASTIARDVAERKRAEASLRESETRFRSFMDNSPAIAFMKDAQGRYVYLNKTYENLTGLRLEDVRGRADTEVWPEHIVNLFRKHDLSVLTTNQPLQAIENSQTPEGRPLTLLNTKFPFETANGERFVGGVGMDITERKRMEDALQESEAKFRAFMDNTPNIAWMEDAQGRYVYFNKAFEDHFGLHLEDCRDKTDNDLFPPELAQLFREHDQRAIAADHPIQVIEESPNPDGSMTTWLVTKFPFTSSGKQFLAGVGVDITERKRLEVALQESESRFRAFMDNSGVPAWMKDEQGRYVYMNKAFERGHFEFRLEDCLNKTDDEIFPLRLAKELRDHDLETLAANRPLQMVENAPDGSSWLVTKFPFLTMSGNRLVAGVGIDITERKKAEEALLRSEKLAATGRLAATIAHEINNPLAAAMNAVYIARTMPAQAGEILELAERELRRAAHITQQTLGFYRDSGHHQQVTAHDVVKEVLSVYATKLQNRNITVHYRHRCSSSSPREGCPEGCKQCLKYLCVNPGELRQVISNLLANGIDALSDGGTMHIRVSRFSDRVQLTMADNGYGIRSENLKRIFEPFFTTKEAYGTGLGLWVTQELVRKHNGVIKVRSRKNKGTVFRLTFPQQRAEDGSIVSTPATLLPRVA